MTVESILLHGEENAISTADLVALTGAKNVRHLQRQIERERLRGALILSSADGGYFLPDFGEKGRRELLIFVRTLQRRAFHTLQTLKAANKALRRADSEQTEIVEGYFETSENRRRAADK